MERELISSSRDVLYQYIKCYEKKMNEGSGLKKKGRKMVFFNDAKQLQEQLGLIKLAILVVNIPIMELNNSVDHIPMIELKKLVDDVPIIELKNIGVDILDMLLETSQINEKQYEITYTSFFQN